MESRRRDLVHDRPPPADSPILVTVELFGSKNVATALPYVR